MSEASSQANTTTTTDTEANFRATSLYASLCDKVLDALQAGPYRSGPPVLEAEKAVQIRGSFKDGRSNSKITRTPLGSASAAPSIVSLASEEARQWRQQQQEKGQNPTDALPLNLGSGEQSQMTGDESSPEGPNSATMPGLEEGHAASAVTHTTSGSSSSHHDNENSPGGSTPPHSQTTSMSSPNPKGSAPPPPPRAVWKQNPSSGGTATHHHADPAEENGGEGFEPRTNTVPAACLQPFSAAAAAAAAGAGTLSDWDTLSAAWTERSADYHLYVATDPVTGQVYLEHLPDLIRIPSVDLPRVCQHICEVVWDAVSTSSRRAQSEEGGADTNSSTVSNSLSLSYVPVYRRQGSELYQSLCEGVWEVLSLGSDAPTFDTMVARLREEEAHARKVAAAASPSSIPPLPPLVPPGRYPIPFTAQHMPDLVMFPLEAIHSVFSSVCDGVWDVVSLLSSEQEARLARFEAERPKLDHLPPLITTGHRQPPDTSRTAAPRERQAPVGCYHVHPVVSRPLHSLLGVPSMRAKAIAETGGRGGLNALRLPPVVFRLEDEEELLNVRSVSSPPNPPHTAALQRPMQQDGDAGDDHRTFLSRPSPHHHSSPGSTPAAAAMMGSAAEEGGVSPLPFGSRGLSCPELDIIVASTVGGSSTTTTTTTTCTGKTPRRRGVSSSTGSSGTACISGFTLPSEYELPPGLMLSPGGMPMFAPAPPPPPPPPPPVVYTSPIYLYRDECVKRERIFWEMIQESMMLFPWPMHPGRRAEVLASIAYIPPDPVPASGEEAAQQETAQKEDEVADAMPYPADESGQKSVEEEEDREREERIRSIALDKKQRRQAEQEKAIQDKALAEVEILQHPALIWAQDYLDGVENFERKSIMTEETRDLAVVEKEYDYEHRLVTVGTLPLERVVRRWINQFRGRRLLQAKQREHLMEREAIARHELLTTDPDLLARHRLLHDAVIFLEAAFRRQIDLLQLRTFYIVGNVQLRLLEHVERFPILFGGTMRKTRACARVSGTTVFVGNQLCEELFRRKIEEMESFERRAVLPFEAQKWSLVNVFEPPERRAVEEEELRERAELQYRLQQLIVYYRQRDVEIYRAVTFDIELERPFKALNVPVIDPFY